MTKKAASSFMLTFAVQFSRNSNIQTGFSAIRADKKYGVDSGYVLNRELLILRNDEFANSDCAAKQRRNTSQLHNLSSYREELFLFFN